jgi:hypothetical protein
VTPICNESLIAFDSCREDTQSGVAGVSSEDAPAQPALPDPQSAATAAGRAPFPLFMDESSEICDIAD